MATRLAAPADVGLRRSETAIRVTTDSETVPEAHGETEPDGPGGSLDEPVESGRADRWTLLSIVAAIAVAAFVLWREAETEPYHIDELRQVRPYAGAFRLLLDASFSQEQPPLDVLVGARFQQVVGVGDVLQRGHSMLAGVVALVCLAVLLWRRRVRFGIPITVLVLAFSPVFISFTAYARPYALPLALMLGYLLAVDTWLDRGRVWSGVAVVAIAGLLPLSRVFEPPAFLVLVSATVLVAWRRNPDWARRVWLPVAAAAAALVLVEIPVYLQLQRRLTAYQGEDAVSLGEQWRRIVDDSLPRLAEVFVNWWMALVLVVAALAVAQVRRRLASLWWFWPLALTPAAFFVAFHLRTQPGQPFYDRYGYFWLPPFAIVLGLLAEQVVAMIRSRPSARPIVPAGAVLAVLLVVYGAQLVAATVDDLRTTTQDDYRSLGVEIERRFPESTSIVFDSVGVPLGSYRPGYAGYGRYTSPTRRVYSAEALLRWPERARGVEQYAIATNGPVVEVDGWQPVPTSATMTLYLPNEQRSGVPELAADLVRFGEALDASVGATLRLAGAQLLFELGEVDEGCMIVGRLLEEDPSIGPALDVSLSRSDNAQRATRCLDDLRS
jgi:hypothetical protein